MGYDEAGPVLIDWKQCLGDHTITGALLSSWPLTDLGLKNARHRQCQRRRTHLYQGACLDVDGRARQRRLCLATQSQQRQAVTPVAVGAGEDRAVTARRSRAEDMLRA